MTIKKFQKIVWDFYRAHKRNLPWRRTTDPYKILVSEVMLQQTQVSRVYGPYRSFLKLFPNFKALAAASGAEVLRAWSGLGYYRRAINLKRAAEMVVKEYRGKLPDSVEEMVKLPGIGKNTAGAVLAYAFNKPVPYIETNIRRVFLHHFFSSRLSVPDSELWPLIENSLPQGRSRQWYQALMDYGTYLASTIENPNRRSRHYSRQSAFEGSVRQLRGKVLKLLMESPTLTLTQLKVLMPDDRLAVVLKQLVKENFIEVKRSRYSLSR